MKKAELFNYLSLNENYCLKDRVKDIYLKKGEYVYVPGQSLQHMYEIVNGAVKLGSYNHYGKERVYDIVSSGDFIGNLKYLNGQFYEYAKTSTSTHLRLYPLGFYKKIIVEDYFASEWFNRYVVERWCRVEMRLFQITSYSIEERISMFKKIFNQTIEDSKGNKYILFNLLNQQDLADLAGTTRQSVASILRKG